MDPKYYSALHNFVKPNFFARVITWAFPQPNKWDRSGPFLVCTLPPFPDLFLSVEMLYNMHSEVLLEKIRSNYLSCYCNRILSWYQYLKSMPRNLDNRKDLDLILTLRCSGKRKNTLNSIPIEQLGYTGISTTTQQSQKKSKRSTKISLPRGYLLCLAVGMLTWWCAQKSWISQNYAKHCTS